MRSHPHIAASCAVAALACLAALSCSRSHGAAPLAAAAQAGPSPDALALPTVLPAAERLGVAPILHSFGTVRGGGELAHVFELHNRGERTLRLKTVSASCGCTRYKLDKEQWAPDERGTLRVQLDTSAKSGLLVASVGLVLVDDAGVETYERFVVECSVDRTEWLYADPLRVDFARVEPGSTAEAAFSIACRSQSFALPPRLVRLARDAAGAPTTLVVELDDGGAMKKIASVDGERVSASGRISWSPDASESELDQRIAFEAVFDDGRVEPVTLNVRGAIAPELAFKPRSVFLAGLVAGETRSAKVQVETHLDALPALRSSNDWLAAEWEDGAAQASGARTLVVTLVVPADARSFSGWIEVAGSSRAYRLPVAGTLR